MVEDAVHRLGRVKKDLDLQLHAVVRVHTSTSTTCVIDGIIKVSKPQ